MEINKLLDEYKSLNDEQLKEAAYKSYKNIAEYILKNDGQIDEWAELVSSCFIVGGHPFLNEKIEALKNFFDHKEVNPEVKKIGLNTFNFLTKDINNNVIENYYYYIEQYALGLKELNYDLIEDVFNLIVVSGIVCKYSAFMEAVISRLKSNVLDKFEY